MNKKVIKLKRDKQRLVTVLLLVVLAIILAVFFFRLHRLEREGCVARLQENTEAAGYQVLSAVNRSQSYLNKISRIVYAECMQSPEAGRNALASLANVDMISRLELFMPDGTLYTPYGVKHDPTLSYDQLMEVGTGATRRALDQMDPDVQIIRLFTPVRDENGIPVALIFGVVRMDRLAELFPVTVYDHQAKLCLMERGTGNYLIDPNNEKPGNLRDVESYLFTQEYNKEEFFRAVRTGESGFTIMRRPSSNSNDYFCFSSVGFQDWMVLLSVKESIAFAQSDTVFFLFLAMLALLVVLAVAFLLWFFRDVRLRQARTELQLQGGRYMLEIQQTLFRAHVDPEAFEQALNEIVSYVTADAVAYYALTADGALNLHAVGGSATKVPPRAADFKTFFPQTSKLVLRDGRFISNRPFLWGDEDWRTAREIGIRDMMMVRLDTLDGKKPLGMLVAVNVDTLWADTEPLDQVALTFSMAVANRQNYQTLTFMSQVDELTGLMNRNSYHARLEELETMEGGTVGCVYIDANGLHEINNHLGHDAGDEMLRSVADALRDSFDKKDTFRLGGDEFAVLVTSIAEEELKRKAQAVSAAVEKCGYTVSVGLGWQRGEPQVHTLVAAAEADMRKNKAEFYASKGGERQMRNLNTRLEQTLSAKRDADTLLSYLAPNLLGVFFVNPAKDICRYIVAPPYFEAALKKTGYSFQGALDVYIKDRVHPDDQQRLRDLCIGYDSLLAALANDGAQEIRFKKVDGSMAILQIRQPRRAGDNTKEIMWLFTQAKF